MWPEGPALRESGVSGWSTDPREKGTRKCGSLVAGALLSMLSVRARFGGGLVAGILLEDALRSCAHVRGRVHGDAYALYAGLLRTGCTEQRAMGHAIGIEQPVRSDGPFSDVRGCFPGC